MLTRQDLYFIGFTMFQAMWLYTAQQILQLPDEANPRENFRID